MNIILAEHLGFCFGVKNIISKTEKLLDSNMKVNVFNDIIHNSTEMSRLFSKGLKKIEEIDNLTPDDIIVLRAHGSKMGEKELLEKHNTTYDYVCPYVKRIQNIVYKNNLDKKVVIIGNGEHPEVISINSYTNDEAIIINEENAELIEKLPNDIEYCIVSQTTLRRDFVNEIINKFDSAKLSYEFHDTICDATRDRQIACKELALKVDAMIVLGDLKSSNSTKLANIARQNNDNVFFVDSIHSIDLNEIRKFNKIGITAGASTPDWIIKEAIETMENFDNKEMMEAIESSFTKIRRGDVLQGTVIYVTDNEVSVNINYRSDGIISKDEVSNSPDAVLTEMFKPGDVIDVSVLKMDDGDGNVVLSYKRVQNLKNWDVVEEMFNNGELVNATIQSVVKGGLKCEVEGLNAFMPASDVSVHFQKDLSQFVGEDLESQIIDFDKSKRRIIVSRREVEKTEIQKVKDEVYNSIVEGDVIEGTVQRLTNFGAFVDIGGVDGLIHISELSWNRVKHPSDVVTPGQTVNVMVLKVDPEKDRIALGLKQTSEEPWVVFTKNSKVGDIVEGKVVNLLDFGAFIRLDSGVDGLLHVSQISRDHVEKPADKLAIGDEVTVKITEIDEENQKISLSIKAIDDDKFKAEKAEAAKVEEEKEKAEVEEFAQADDDFNTSIGDMLNLED
ncbi:MAG: bifunctional 4-hydroxy-3-methylbut-2-enyl diphosphate reductase/30S ribosomal protein S1 [Tissierellia bacterium]|nr:bifunctional 4-hydroxy-3-methylbut-2-enyl diphosphate reductase/30S ribosomal protein S1 [Tissierellia bacterium]